MSINKNLRQLRLDSGMTQEQAAEKLGVTRQALSSYELGRTRPDIDMLMSLAKVYGTDLDGILYGVNRKLRAARRVKAAAAIMFLLLISLTMIRSAILWSANHFFSLPKGPMTQEKRELFEVRRRLLTAWETMDGVLLTAALFGALLLGSLMLAGKCAVPLKQKLAYAAALAGGVLIAAIPFAVTDPVYTAVDYMITPIRLVFRVLFFLGAILLMEYLLNRKKNIQAPAD